mmetsp:Transcript_35085/g.92383  ORF Transcript_35085/g.92383 Transcript_35085/m.92383 type:complete len:163 (-) Transcript_35085:51-539(-)
MLKLSLVKAHTNAFTTTHNNFTMRGPVKEAPGRQRTVLTKWQVLEIFQIRMDGTKISAAELGARFGVCEKTIRDIWRGRSWRRETDELKDCIASSPSSYGQSIETEIIQVQSHCGIMHSFPRLRSSSQTSRDEQEDNTLCPIDDVLFLWNSGIQDCIDTDVC